MSDATATSLCKLSLPHNKVQASILTRQSASSSSPEWKDISLADKRGLCWHSKEMLPIQAFLCKRVQVFRIVGVRQPSPGPLKTVHTILWVKMGMILVVLCLMQSVTLPLSTPLVLFRKGITGQSILPFIAKP